MEPDEKLVYQATKRMFGKRASKFILTEQSESLPSRDIIMRCLKNMCKVDKTTQLLVRGYGIDLVSQTVLRLLLAGVYHSEVKATEHFLSLCEPAETSTQSSEDEQTISRRKEIGNESVYLPFDAQHMLMAKIQQILEQACFEFCQRLSPNILAVQRWNCAESAELNKWARAIRRDKHLAKNREGKPLFVLVSSICQIRHAVVHRLPKGLPLLDEILTDSIDFLKRLKDPSRAERINKLQLGFRTMVKDLIQDNSALGKQLAESRAVIAEQRDFFDPKKQEIAAMTKALRNKYLELAGEKLKREIKLMENSTKSPTVEPVATDAEIPVSSCETRPAGETKTTEPDETDDEFMDCVEYF